MTTLTIAIDGRRVTAGAHWTLLETAREYGFDIPTLCYHEALEPYGACRLCVVEAWDGKTNRLVASCVTKPTPNLVVRTESERVKNARQWIFEMLLAECPASKELWHLAAKHGITGTRFPIHDMNELCILCGNCVRVCQEIVGVEALGYGSRGTAKHIATPYMEPSASCIACGSCLTVCPTGAMQARFDKIRGDMAQRAHHKV